MHYQPHHDNSFLHVIDTDATAIESCSHFLDNKVGEEIKDPLNEHRLPISEKIVYSPQFQNIL